MRPPRFRMLTPSGRFEINTRLCLSMSDYHPESWNPSWSVETLLVGLQSFMYEENNTAIGSIKTSAKTRASLASQSQIHNSKNAMYMECFGEIDLDLFIQLQQEKLGESKEDVVAESLCRFCHESNNEECGK